MNRLSRSAVGVTLLEIMLVLAIAAMVIVMSIRYYQSATASQQANQALSQMQAIIASADQLAQTTGTYVAATGPKIAQMTASSGGLKTPWPSTSPIVIGSTATTLTITFPDTPSAACGIILGRLSGDVHYTTTVTDCGTAKLSLPIVYTPNV